MYGEIESKVKCIAAAAAKENFMNVPFNVAFNQGGLHRCRWGWWKGFKNEEAIIMES